MSKPPSEQVVTLRELEETRNWTMPSELIEIAESTDKTLTTTRGPYSFTRLNTCNQQFKFKYIDDKDGQDITRFDQEAGSAIHDLLEYDIQARLREPDQPPSEEDLVDHLAHNHPEYSDHIQTLTEQLQKFRRQFDFYPEDYVGSEEYLAANFAFGETGYRDEDAWYRGLVDYLEIDDQGHARAVDFKNYPRVHSHNKFNDVYEGVGAQLTGYAAMVMANYSAVESFHYEVYYTRKRISKSVESSYYTQDGEQKRRTFDREFIEDEWWPWLQRKMISKERLPERAFNPQPSRKSCQYCSFVEECPVSFDNETIARNEDEAEGLLDELTNIEERRTRLKDALNEYSKEHGYIENGHGSSYGYKTYKKVDWNERKILEAIAMYLDDPDLEDVLDFVGNHLSFNKRSVDKLVNKLSDDDALEDYLEEEAKHERTKSRLDSSV